MGGEIIQAISITNEISMALTRPTVTLKKIQQTFGRSQWVL